jgi:hypothetical protein
MHGGRGNGGQAGGGLSRRATLYLYGVLLAAAAAAVPALAVLETSGRELATFILLGGAAALAQLLLVETGKNHGFPIGIAFLVAGALLLPPGLLVLLVLVQHAPDIVLRRYPWYIQSFNTANFTLNGLAAWATAQAFSELGTPGGDVRWAAAGLAACVVFVGLNHVLLAGMLLLARGHGLRASGLFSRESISIDLVMAVIGIALAALSTSNVALIVVVVAPLLLADRLLRLMAATNGGGTPSRQPAS